MDLNLSKSQALFVVFREWNAEPPRALPPGAGERIAIGGPWRVRYEGLNAPTNRVLEVLADQTASDEDDLKFFSGTTVYETVFAWDGAPGAATLELGKVGVSAEVRVNGKLLGTAWTKPYRLGGLEKLLRKGENRLDIRTCNTWANRLIGDMNLPESERKTWAMRSRLGRDEPLGKYPSGLIGPVAIRRASPADTIFQDKQEPDPSTLRQLRFLAFNVWGDFFGNPVHERDLQELEIIVGHDPDFIGLQEVTPNFWKSRLVSGLDSAGFECVGAEMGPDDRHRNAANPVFFCKSRFELLEKGSKWFHPELDYSKGVVWAAVREKATGRKFVIFASHFWWEQKSRGDDYLRLANARMLHETVAGAAKRHGASIIGGGDLNAPVSSSALAELKKLGWCDAQEKSPDTDPRATCREMPERDETGVYRGIEHEKAKTPEWLDHVFYSPESITPVKFAMDRTQKALDTSDHSPVIFDFTTEESTLKANVPPPPSGGVVE